MKEEEKDVGAQVAAPVIIDLKSARPITRKETSSPNDIVGLPVSAVSLSSQDKPVYLHYEPGVHLTTGPLPSLPPP
ncbi:hypothetical protein H2248_011488 [Termitomyces sp. 'cryptogamus']|nr:hypothetical protein H2248_011488 [Termitomyces sp. 'cryptogamus']